MILIGALQISIENHQDDDGDKYVFVTGVHREGDTYCDNKNGDTCVGRKFVGTGDPTVCLRLLKRFVYKVDDPSLCQPKPCAIGSFYQPTLPPDMDFYAVGAFIYPLHAIEALDSEWRYRPQVGFEKAFEYCRKVLTFSARITAEMGMFPPLPLRLSVPATVRVPGIPEGDSFCPWHCRCTRIADK